MPVSIVFWIAFFIIVFALFFIFAPEIKKNLGILANGLNLPAGFASKTVPAQNKLPEPEPVQSIKPAPEEKPLPKKPAVADEQPPAAQPPEKPAEATEKPSAVQPAENPPPEKPSTEASPSPPAAKPEAQPAVAKPAAQTVPKQPPVQARPQPAAQPPLSAAAETRSRNIYFTQVDRDGTVLRSKVSRKLTVSDSPMLDSLNALLAGPTAEEQRRGLVNLIPANTRILSAIVRGSTAYISFSEDFQYNTYGVEGYAAQLKQIVWTATEFSNINDVQILIEGRRVDYLGEGIWIGGPISRESF